MKGTEKVLKEELKQYFKGHEQRLNMLSKLVLSIIKMGAISCSILSLVFKPFSAKRFEF